MTFQQFNRPLELTQEGKVFFFFGKHKLYQRRVEVSVLSNGIALYCSENLPGAISDLTILLYDTSLHEFFCLKQLLNWGRVIVVLFQKSTLTRDMFEWKTFCSICIYTETAQWFVDIF